MNNAGSVRRVTTPGSVLVPVVCVGSLRLSTICSLMFTLPTVFPFRRSRDPSLSPPTVVEGKHVPNVFGMASPPGRRGG